MFIKRRGTTDKGKDYEHLYIASLVLKLIIDETVENFYLSSNDDEFGSFDDVVVKIILKDPTETYAVQLKHVTRKVVLIERLNSPSGEFSIEKYYENFKKHEKLKEPSVKMVLFTNCKLNTEHLNRFKFGKLTPCEQNNLISYSEGSCYTFEASEDNLEKYELFFKNLCLCSDQPDVRQLKKEIFETLETQFGSNESVCREYVDFITQWSMKEGEKFKLNKTWMKHVIALCVFSPFTKPLSFVEGKSVNDKEKIFREAVSKCDLAVIDEHNFERIESIWSDVVDDLDDVESTSKINNLYELIEDDISTKASLYSADLLKVSRLMWLLGKSPLVVEGCPQVYQAIKTCQARNLIILDDQETFNDKIVERERFLLQNLSDLKKHTQLYEEIIKNFTYSLEGQREIELKFLVEMCDVDNLISTDDLVEMLDAPLLIGNLQEVLPPSHIERRLTKILIDVDFLKNTDPNAVALIDSVTNGNLFQQNLSDVVVTIINDVDKIQDTIHSVKIYITSETDISQEKFNTLCKENSDFQFHHFKYLDEHRLEWLRSENCESFEKLENFQRQTEYMEFIDERQYFSESRQNINIICADPGMGKSTLMKSLKSVSFSSKWIILIYTRNHAHHFRKNKSDMDKFLIYVLKITCKKYSNPLHQIVFKTMLEQDRIEVAWDGLDEASDATQMSVLSLVKTFSERNVKQWVTSRNNLKSVLENILATFSRSIKEFDDDEQREYISSRLQLPEEELSQTITKIRDNVMAFPNYEILGIPLQIYMLTELFLQDKEKYLDLLNYIFTVLDLYEHFVDEKFRVLYEEKKEIVLSNEQNEKLFVKEKETKMNYYKRLAASSYIYNSFVEKLFKINRRVDKEVKSFFEKIKSEGDDVGFISRVTSDDVEFAHNSYGEYFAALYLFEHRSSKARDKKFISNGRYNNIRFFLDLMLTRKCKGFVGVIYKNFGILGELTEADLKQKDVIGRDILEVACAWTKNYPIAKNNTVLRNSYFNPDWMFKNEKVEKYLSYRDVGPKFIKFSSSTSACFQKLLIFLPFLIPLYDGNQFADDYLGVVLYYAVRFDFSMIFECIENSLPLKNTYSNISTRSVLAVALYNRSKKILNKLFSEEKDYFEWDCVWILRASLMETERIFAFMLELEEFKLDVPNSDGQLLIHFASEYRLIKTLSLLILNGVKLDVPDRSGRLPIHYACGEADVETVEFLLKIGAEINAPDKDGLLPIHYACKNFHYGFTIIKFLIEKGAKVDSPDADGRLVIHYACESTEFESVEFLLKNGAEVNVPDKDGLLAIHYACKHFFFGWSIISLLIEKGAKVDSPDPNGRLPIHYACEYGYVTEVESIVANGAKVDAPDGNGRLSMHYACSNPDWRRIIPFLIEKGAKVDTPDGDGRLPIHYACEHGNLDMVKFLVTNGAKVTVRDGDGQLPVDYASKNEKYAKEITKFLTEQNEIP
ncbi:hypothetical protein Zmor_006431 [Zophobas morio]|uniref:Uncharacterized protein n=1 Tax=Zophobas morio TaxID=2755281 RepID=A0AA38IX97_9CUCU|nr:hypothetical protein Zmor_006431 [Zophobas morio]